MPRAQSIVVLGDINIDILGPTVGFPRPGEDCQSRKLELHLGGVAANSAFALKQWHVQPRLVGCIGRDVFGVFLQKLFKQHRLDTRWIQTTSGETTGLCYINVTPDGQRTFFGSRGASRVIRKPIRAQVLFHRVAALHLVGYNFIDPVTESTAQFLLKAARRHGAWVALDVGPEPAKAIPQKILQAASQADILFANREEARLLTLQHDPHQSFRGLLNTGARDVVLKLGKEGCLILDGGQLTQVPSFAVNAVDSTGAGDAFVAAFLQARLRGWPKAEAALAANAAGAAAACVIGAGEKLPPLREILCVLEKPFASVGSEINWESLRQSTLSRVRALRRSNPEPRKSRARH